MKCIIIEDEPKAIDVLDRYIARIPFLSLEATFRDAISALAYLQSNPVDLIFLDINMPQLSGIEFLQTLDKAPAIIFTTAYAEHALTAYEYHVVDYLLKPIEFERFLKAVNRANKLFLLEQKGQSQSSPVSKDMPTEEFMLLKSGSKTHKVAVKDILYLKKDANYIDVVTKDKKIPLRLNMNQVFDVFASKYFVRIHKSYVVAIAHINVLEVHQLSIGQERIPIGVTYREALMNRLNKTS